MGRTIRDAPVTSVRGHLKELRNRLIAIALVFGIASGFAYSSKDILLEILLAPLEGEQLSYLTVGGGFSFIFMLTIWCGIAAVLPFMAYSIYRFIAPAIPERARTKAPVVFIASFVLLLCGFSFGYFVAIPNAIHFLLTFADEYVRAMLTADSYLGFILAYTIGLGVLFQLPLVMVIINWITPLSPKKLFSIERYVIVMSFVLAAIVTPTPDVWNQTIIALPLIAMYQMGVFMVMLINWHEKRRTAGRTTEIRQPELREAFVTETSPRPKPRHTPAPQPSTLKPARVAPERVNKPPKLHRAIDGVSIVQKGTGSPVSAMY